MQAVTHYEVLGIGPGASGDEIRAAYLELARRTHPDQHQTESSRERAEAERRMREINVAYRVLADPEQRERYDLSLPDAPSRVVSPSTSRGWTPVEPESPEDDLDPRDLVDDRPFGDGSRPPQALTLAPALFLLVAVGTFSLGLVVRAPTLLAIGVVAAALTGISLLAAPAVALAKAWRVGDAAGSSGGDGRR